MQQMTISSSSSKRHIMQLGSIFSLDPSCLGNTHVFQTLHPLFVTQFLLKTCSLQGGAHTDNDWLTKLSQRHRRHYRTVFTGWVIALTTMIKLKSKVDVFVNSSIVKMSITCSPASNHIFHFLGWALLSVPGPMFLAYFHRLPPLPPLGWASSRHLTSKVLNRWVVWTLRRPDHMFGQVSNICAEVTPCSCLLLSSLTACSSSTPTHHWRSEPANRKRSREAAWHRDQ